jgi:hypothetical protein
MKAIWWNEGDLEPTNDAFRFEYDEYSFSEDLGSCFRGSQLMRIYLISFIITTRSYWNQIMIAKTKQFFKSRFWFYKWSTI